MGQGKGNGDKDRSNVFVLLCILVLIVGIVAAAGMIMAVLNYNNRSDKPINIMMPDRQEYGGVQYVPSPPIVIGGSSESCPAGGSGNVCTS